MKLTRLELLQRVEKIGKDLTESLALKLCVWYEKTRGVGHTTFALRAAGIESLNGRALDKRPGVILTDSVNLAEGMRREGAIAFRLRDTDTPFANFPMLPDNELMMAIGTELRGLMLRLRDLETELDDELPSVAAK